jgi:hypothetical protein
MGGELAVLGIALLVQLILGVDQIVADVDGGGGAAPLQEVRAAPPVRDSKMCSKASSGYTFHGEKVTNLRPELGSQPSITTCRDLPATCVRQAGG